MCAQINYRLYVDGLRDSYELSWGTQIVVDARGGDDRINLRPGTNPGSSLSPPRQRFLEGLATTSF